jgi:hypothetical protein
MRTTSSLREWIFALVMVAAFSIAAFYLIGDHFDVSAGGDTTTIRFGRAESPSSFGAIITREHGQCRQVRFDKATGEVQDNSLGPCPEGNGIAANSTEGRMQSIRQSFSGR